MNWKKDFKTSALIILLVITAIALLDNARGADSAAKLEEEQKQLEQKVTGLEKEIERRSRMTDDLKDENDTLAVNLSNTGRRSGGSTILCSISGLLGCDQCC